MRKGETQEAIAGPAPAPQARPAPDYAPPAVAWEEEFDPLAQSCSVNPGLPECQGGGEG